MCKYSIMNILSNMKSKPSSLRQITSGTVTYIDKFIRVFLTFPILAGTKHKLGRSVPSGDDLVGEFPAWRPELLGQTEIAYFYDSVQIDQQVVRFQIPV